ncbi:gluconokinase [Microbacterium hydrocarbonoxydans]|uniref:gluconokinase n=1 Tax=Microbacterium hydrocarbonoxydans TaxID=273678 RepID=UPI0007BB9B72|nr:gluconokinase [Microbacterium hydrocarbonoxydans]GAT71884.1 gluconokinase [Microbacterium sp. HM58-2]
MTGENVRPADADPPIVLVVMGVSGSGKSTVAGMLAGRLGWDLEEGDDLHPASNIEKMAAGHPLTDEDRWPWLDRIAAWIQLHTASGTPGIVTCSALRRVYRDRLAGPGVAFVHLDGSREAIANRLSSRIDHFMPQSLLGSQFATLEPLEEDEDGIVVELSRSPKEEVKEIMRRLRLSPLPPPEYTADGLLAG